MNRGQFLGTSLRESVSSSVVLLLFSWLPDTSPTGMRFLEDEHGSRQTVISLVYVVSLARGLQDLPVLEKVALRICNISVVWYIASNAHFEPFGTILVPQSLPHSPVPC